MDEYIKRKEIRRAYEKLARSYMHGEPYIADWKFDEMIEELPATDAAPVRHGRWIADGDGYHWTYNCSICAWKDGYPFNERHNYCPNCGAKMDLDIQNKGQVYNYEILD